jgi:hypothetical protein
MQLHSPYVLLFSGMLLKHRDNYFLLFHRIRIVLWENVHIASGFSKRFGLSVKINVKLTIVL